MFSVRPSALSKRVVKRNEGIPPPSKQTRDTSHPTPSALLLTKSLRCWQGGVGRGEGSTRLVPGGWESADTSLTSVPETPTEQTAECFPDILRRQQNGNLIFKGDTAEWTSDIGWPRCFFCQARTSRFSWVLSPFYKYTSEESFAGEGGMFVPRG